MKNKKGFTLMELLVCIALLGLIALIASISFISVNNNQKQKDYENIVENIISASKTYVGLNKNNVKDNLKDLNTVDLPLTLLIENGLLDEAIKDPRTKEKISHNNKVKVEYNSATGEITYTYNYE